MLFKSGFYRVIFKRSLSEAGEGGTYPGEEADDVRVERVGEDGLGESQEGILVSPEELFDRQTDGQLLPADC